MFMCSVRFIYMKIKLYVMVELVWNIFETSAGCVRFKTNLELKSLSNTCVDEYVRDE